jgi:DNA polymerase (family 10)
VTIRRRISNDQVERALREIALFLEMDDVPFKPTAYRRAAYGVASLDRPLEELYDEGGPEALRECPGVGEGIAERIAEMIERGRIADLEALRKKTPVDILALTGIEGVGPKRVRALWKALKVRTVEDLERAASEGLIRGVPGFGARSEKRIAEALAFYQEAAGRRPLGEALAVARRIEEALGRTGGDRARVAVAGSIRRHRETVGDLDIVVAAESGDDVSRVFESLPEVRSVLAHGPTKTLVRLSNGMDADLRVVDPGSFGAALLYFTGSKAHNVALRKIARSRGLKLNEYGLFRGRHRIAGRTEEDVYAALGLSWIPPEMREDTGEVELARKKAVPPVVSAGDIRGDLQVHTNWTDGSDSIESMARAALELGREYIVVTDHTRDLGMARGLDEARLRKQMKEIRRVDRELEGIRVLAGAEVNIRADGTLDADDDVLSELDVVGAAVHSHFEQPRSEITRRLVRAIENPHVDVLFHPMGRALGRRKAVAADFEEVIEACVGAGTILEIDSQPERLDLSDYLVRRAVEAGAQIAIDSDAHTPDELRYIELYGVGVARRGWAPPDRVVNTLGPDEMLASLGG